jgi:hypothetical protein
MFIETVILHTIISVHLTSFLLLGDIFFHADPTFSIFDEVVKEIPNKTYRLVIDESHHNSVNSLSDLVLPCNMVEALLPVLASIVCLHLNSRSGRVEKHIAQTVFACVLFFNHAKLVPFPINS